jgi:cobalamin biosynthesis protein CobT
MARRTLNRKELRAQAEAAERQVDETEDEDEAEDEEDVEDEDEDREEGGGEEDAEEGAPKKKKKPKPKPKAPKATKPRKSRTAKVTRMKVIWGVFNNSNQRVAAFEYPRRSEADALAAKLTSDKKSTHFVQPVKEPMEEKKEA